MKVSLYRNIKSTSPVEYSVFKALEDIRVGKYSKEIKQVRFYANDKPNRDIEKAKLPLIGWSGTFKARSNTNLIKHSGLACLDFDKIDDLMHFRSMVDADDYTFASYISPSGGGMHVLVKIPMVDNDKDYKSFYSELRKHYDEYWETDATNDISRAMYVSYDPDLHINLDSQMFTDRFVQKVVPKRDVLVKVSDMSEIANRLINWYNKKWTTGENRNTNLFTLSSFFNEYGVDKSVALDYCLGYQSSDFGENEINRLVDSAYKKTENFGTKFYEDKDKLNQVKKLAFVGNSYQEIVSKVGPIDESVVDKIQEEMPKDVFWEINDKGKINISFYRFDIYLKNKGISKFYQDDKHSEYDFIKKDGNFINWIDTKRIKDLVKNDLISQGHIDVWDLMAGSPRYFNADYLSMLDTIDVDYKKDDKDTSYLYYKNYAVKTTKEGSELIDYKDIGSLVWKNQVIDRDIELKPESDGVFKSFIWKVSGDNADRYYTLKSVIGHLLHSYQSESKPKTIIFNDEMVSDDVPNGGSGKGLIHKAIGKLKNIVIEDGKKFDAKMQFAYQKVRRDTQIFLMDDVNKGFNFENLFSIVTEGMTVEYKGKDPFTIPFSESPKLSVTTNYTVKGDGPSFRRRVFEVELANYFNDKHTPEDEFGHQFFGEWSKEEWQRFDNFMIRCIQFFLKNGLVESKKVNLDFRKFKDNVGVEFIEFMQSKDLDDGFTINRKIFRDQFNEQYRHLAKYNTAQKFNKKVKDYCDYYKYELSEHKNGGVVFFNIKLKLPF